jgi:hypothetical protein
VESLTLCAVQGIQALDVPILAEEMERAPSEKA